MTVTSLPWVQSHNGIFGFLGNVNITIKYIKPVWLADQAGFFALALPFSLPLTKWAAKKLVRARQQLHSTGFLHRPLQDFGSTKFSFFRRHNVSKLGDNPRQTIVPYLFVYRNCFEYPVSDTEYHPKLLWREGYDSLGSNQRCIRTSPAQNRLSSARFLNLPGEW